MSWRPKSLPAALLASAVSVFFLSPISSLRIERIGHVPLPPYIDRGDRPEDLNRYQTVYATTHGSVAAPTAGLHFTPEILAQIRARGIETAEITLHVGLGTFQPVRVEKVEDHKLHRESLRNFPPRPPAPSMRPKLTAGADRRRWHDHRPHS